MGVVFCARSGVSGRVCSGLGVSWYWMRPPPPMLWWWWCVAGLGLYRLVPGLMLVLSWHYLVLGSKVIFLLQLNWGPLRPLFCCGARCTGGSMASWGSQWGTVGRAGVTWVVGFWVDLWGLCQLGRPDRSWDRGVSVRATWPAKLRFSRGTF